MLASAYAGPDRDRCGGPLKVIVHSKKQLNLWYSNLSLDEQLKWTIFRMFIYF